MEPVNYAPLLPTEPPEGLVKWLVEELGLLQRNLLIYKADWFTDPLTEQREHYRANARPSVLQSKTSPQGKFILPEDVKSTGAPAGRKHSGVKLTCTACGQSQYVDKVSNQCHHGGPAFGFIQPEVVGSGNLCLCPICGGEVEAKHVGSLSQCDCVEAYPMTVHKIGTALVLCGWCVRKWFEKDGRSGITVWPYEAYVVEEKKVVRLNAYHKYMNRVSLTGKWEQRKQFQDVWGKADLVYPWLPTLLEGTVAENSKLDVFWMGQVRPATYLRLWQKHSNIENLVMQGAGALVAELMENELDNRQYMSPRPKGLPELGVNWKEKRPAQMLGLTKEEFRRCLAEGWRADTLHYFQAQKEKGRVLRSEELQLCVDLGLHHCRKLEDCGQDAVKVARYVVRQKKKDQRCDMGILNDYWRMAVVQGYDVANPDVRYPPNLYRAHERVVEERRQAQAKQEKKKQRLEDAAIRKRAEELSALCWERDGILIRPAESGGALRREGVALHHCVGNYTSSVAEGKTAIFFLRRVAEPDKPWYTLELDEKKREVRQNRGSHNCARTEEVVAFEAAWLEHLRVLLAKPEKKRKKRGNAA